MTDPTTTTTQRDTATAIDAARPGLALRGVGASPGGVAVLRDVDLVVPTGTTTAVVGPSGAGKTTLLRVVAGLEAAAAGTVEVDGRDVTTVPAHRRGVGVVFQEPRLFPDRTVVDNVAFGLEMAGVGRDERRTRSIALLDRVGLGGTADRPVTGLSGGEQQRVNLARALALDPPLLLLDEPLAAVDPDRREDLRVLLREVTTGITALYVTHERSEAAELGDHVAVVLEGRIVQHTPPRELFERPASAAVARLVGAGNILHGHVVDGRFAVGGGHVAAAGPDGPATLAVRPEHVAVGGGGVPATVVAARYLGTHVRLELVCDDGTSLEADVPTGSAPGVGTTTTFDLPDPWRLPLA
jgi:ABC-type Fe3+/spermidine/putrescine transport system ATPase subunit